MPSASAAASKVSFEVRMIQRFPQICLLWSIRSGGRSPHGSSCHQASAPLQNRYVQPERSPGPLNGTARRWPTGGL